MPQLPQLLGSVCVVVQTPLQTFGMKHSPYSGLYLQDFWKLHPNITVNLGIRFDYWHEKRAVRGNVGSFDPRIGKALAGEDKNGQVDLTAQPVARFVAKATEGLWVSSSQAGVPRGLFDLFHERREPLLPAALLELARSLEHPRPEILELPPEIARLARPF